MLDLSMLARFYTSLISTHVAQDFSAEQFAEIKVVNSILVLRDPLFLAIDQFERVQEVGRCHRSLSDGALHRFLLLF